MNTIRIELDKTFGLNYVITLLRDDVEVDSSTFGHESTGQMTSYINSFMACNQITL
ncbi:hypothetical protein [Methanospirillum sp.]